MAKKEGLAPKRPLGWSQLFKDIRAGKAVGVYLFYGPEEFVKKSAVDQLRAALLPPGLELLNEDVLENVDATAIIESAETLPVMCDQRFVLVKDWPPLFKGGDQEADKLEKWLPNAPQSCVLVFYAGGAEPNRATKVTKALYEYAQVTEFPLLDDEELGRRLGKAFREQGKRVEKDAVSQLIFLAGRDLNRLLGEVQKLANYVGDAEVVTAGDVRAIVTPSTEAGVFLMIDAMMEGRAREAYSVLSAMTDAGENRVQILATLIWQMRLIAHVAIQRDKRMTLPQIQATIRERPFAVRNAFNRCGRIPSARCLALYEKCVSLDYAVKSGRMRDEEALDAAMRAILEEKQKT